ncbi:hypothetical protein BA896_009310 [Janthinobacterium lividum]|uniref:Transposase IS66 zinc-finger binding domain-containing protein n=1 Tax=Janthinobacterium lividum TaxID=29581 RepID=A0A1E8PRX8_9BURK|nr:hypothetical protein BA896_009310 [Janthinobacterium lividum]
MKGVAEPIQTVDHRLPQQCLRCHSALPLVQAEGAKVAERRQVIDLPTTVFDVIEHCTLAVTCNCGQAYVNRFPAGVSKTVQYGPNVRVCGNI